jgi:Trk K+ transport system NAD-binding subunit
MRPTAVEFVDTIMSASNAELLLEDLTIPEKWSGRALSEFVGDAEDAIVLAIKRGATMIFRPPGSTMLVARDEVVAAGPAAAIRILEKRLA